MSFDYADEGFDLDYSERQGFLVGKAEDVARIGGILPRRLQRDVALDL